MLRNGAIIFGDLIGKPGALRIERPKAVWATPANRTHCEIEPE
jgi:hypothetical protein